MTKIVTRFQFERSTKGTHFYKEIDEQGDVIEDYKQAKIGSIYIRKSSLPTPSRVITVSIETND